MRDALTLAHDALGHFGHERTYDRLASTYYRPGLAAAVREYVRYCPSCNKNKTSKAKTVGSLEPIDPPGTLMHPTKAFENISMPLIGS